MTEVPVFNFVTTQQLADLFGVKKDTIRYWVRKGKFPEGMKAPGGRRWSYSVVEKFMERGQASPKTIKAILESN